MSLTNVSAILGPRSYKDWAAIADSVEHALRLLPQTPSLVNSGDRVVLKPNWIKEHDQRFPGPGQWQHVITHPTVIEAVARWAARQLQGRGSIILCDAPQNDSSFAKIREYCGLDGLLARLRADFPGVQFTLLELRPEDWQAIDGVAV